MPERIELTKEQSARVLFASDRTCCVCRSEKKAQIHHIDGDPSNNAWDNLAVLCLLCHSEAHTNGAFVRSLTPEVVRLYNASWRSIVALRLNPQADPTGKREYESEVFLEISLDCHAWKVLYMSLHRFDFPGATPGSLRDVWDAMIELWRHEYSPEVYQKLLPLFDNGIPDIKRRFDRAILLYADILPYGFRSGLVRANRQLQTQLISYRHFHEWVSGDEARTATFNSILGETVRVLAGVAREADRIRSERTPAPADDAG